MGGGWKRRGAGGKLSGLRREERKRGPSTSKRYESSRTGAGRRAAADGARAGAGVGGGPAFGARGRVLSLSLSAAARPSRLPVREMSDSHPSPDPPPHGPRRQPRPSRPSPPATPRTTLNGCLVDRRIVIRSLNVYERRRQSLLYSTRTIAAVRPGGLSTASWTASAPSISGLGWWAAGPARPQRSVGRSLDPVPALLLSHGANLSQRGASSHG